MQPLFRKFRELFYGVKTFDRRKYIRYEPKRHIECVCFYTISGRQTECRIDIVNISKGGLLMVTGEQRIYPGAEVEIKFQLSPQYVISIQGMIGRTYRKQGKKWHYSTVEFQNPEEKGIQLVLDFALGKS